MIIFFLYFKCDHILYLALPRGIYPEIIEHSGSIIYDNNIKKEMA